MPAALAGILGQARVLPIFFTAFLGVALAYNAAYASGIDGK